MITTKDNNRKPIGIIETLTSNDRVVTINQLRQVATVTMRERMGGQVKTATFFGNLTLVGKD